MSNTRNTRYEAAWRKRVFEEMSKSVKLKANSNWHSRLLLPLKKVPPFILLERSAHLDLELFTII
ncbi:hypothetical protein [Chloroherpeton thalassium]|uniref:hypothetical protein n=1 Tax=Chloroherpeton thalassium TaxID=100716 RepID=UPI000304CE1A|nr:hypothetical protein [Chloroherpeton thalassium]